MGCNDMKEDSPITFDIHDVVHHLSNLWDDVHKLKKEVRELKEENKELQAQIRVMDNALRMKKLLKDAPPIKHIDVYTLGQWEE